MEKEKLKEKTLNLNNPLIEVQKMLTKYINEAENEQEIRRRTRFSMNILDERIRLEGHRNDERKAKCKYDFDFLYFFQYNFLFPAYYNHEQIIFEDDKNLLYDVYVDICEQTKHEVEFTKKDLKSYQVELSEDYKANVFEFVGKKFNIQPLVKKMYFPYTEYEKGKCIVYSPFTLEYCEENASHLVMLDYDPEENSLERRNFGLVKNEYAEEEIVEKLDVFFAGKPVYYA